MMKHVLAWLLPPGNDLLMSYSTILTKSGPVFLLKWIQPRLLLPQDIFGLKVGLALPPGFAMMRHG